MSRPKNSQKYLSEHMSAVDAGLAGIKRNFAFSRDAKLRKLVALTESAFADVTRHVEACTTEDTEDRMGA